MDIPDRFTVDVTAEPAPYDGERACEGGRVVEHCDMAECIACGTRVRWDLQNHRLFGFQNCVRRHEK